MRWRSRRLRLGRQMGRKQRDNRHNAVKNDTAHDAGGHLVRDEGDRQQNRVGKNSAPQGPLLFTSGRIAGQIEHSYCSAVLASAAWACAGRVVGAAASSSSTGGLPLSSSLAT